jgi:energy-coupling factor transport system ATP-binding protein
VPGRASARQTRIASDTTFPPLLSLHEIWFRYERQAPDILRGTSLEIHTGELCAIIGGNATGKTTLLGVIAGLLKPWRGRVQQTEGAALLPQDPRLLFTHKTVREELEANCHDEQQLKDVIEQCELTALLDRHPFDVSGGEAQRVALADVLLTRPKLLLLDEPSKGMDAAFKEHFAALLQDLTVVMVSHDIEFCARHADRCCLLFDGQITAEGTPHEFFSELSYYTTAARRISRGIVPDAITVSDIVAGLSA